LASLETLRSASRAVLLGLAALLLTAPLGHAKGYRLALVIGNGDYQIGRLKNAESDAKLLARTLRRLGFRVTLKLNADRAHLAAALEVFKQKILHRGPETTGLVYYAGHGIQVKGTNYLIPIKAKIRSLSDIRSEAVRVDKILNHLANAHNRINFVILDACRSNPFAGAAEAESFGLAEMSAPNGTLIAYATFPGGLATDGKGDNSPYAKALTDAMKQQGVPAETMFRQVRIKVMHATAGYQVPWEQTSLTRGFYFTPEKVIIDQ